MTPALWLLAILFVVGAICLIRLALYIRIDLKPPTGVSNRDWITVSTRVETHLPHPIPFPTKNKETKTYTRVDSR